MVAESVVSNQAASIKILAYTALDGDDTFQTARIERGA